MRATRENRLEESFAYAKRIRAKGILIGAPVPAGAPYAPGLGSVGE